METSERMAGKGRHAVLLAVAAAALALACVCAVTPPAVQADTGVDMGWDVGSPTETDVRAVLYEDGTLVFSGSGAMKTYSQDNLPPWCEYGMRSKVKSIRFESGVNPTNLDYFFYHCDFLENPSGLPSSVTSMVHTFENCDRLGTLDKIPDAVTNMEGTFYGAAISTVPALPKGLKSMNDTFKWSGISVAPAIPSGVTSMRYTFYGCKSLKEAPYIPSGVTDMMRCFTLCENLTQLPSGFKLPDKKFIAAFRIEDSSYRAYDKLVPTCVDSPAHFSIDDADTWARWGRKLYVQSELDIESKAVVDMSDKTYTGSPICPNVSLSGYTAGEDYEVVYEDNKDVGYGHITIKGIHNYKGSKTYPFRITRKEVVVTSGVTASDKGYDSRTDAVLDCSRAVIEGRFDDDDLSVTARGRFESADVGEGKTVYLSGWELAGTAAGNYSLAASGHQQTTTASIKICVVDFATREDVDLKPKTYTGSQISPDAGLKGMREGTDYDVTYGKNVDAGIGTFTIKCKNNYQGEKSYEFEIRKKKITFGGVRAKDKVYDGTTSVELDLTYKWYDGKWPPTDEVLLSVSGAFSTPDVEYDDEGKAKKKTVRLSDCSISGASAKNYELDVSGSQTTTTAAITPKQIDFDEMAVVDTHAETYTGSEIKPRAFLLPTTIGNTLKGRDYTVGYSNNVNAGTGAVTIAGKGNWTGSETWTFTISPAEIKFDEMAVVDTEEKTYKGSEITPKAKVEGLSAETDYTVSYSDNVNAGTGTITIAGKGNWTGSKTWGFKIVPKDLDLKDDPEIGPVFVDDDPKAYTGAQIKPTLSIDDRKEGVDYEVVYGRNENVGTKEDAKKSKEDPGAYPKGGWITVNGIGNWTGTKTWYFEITAQSIDFARLAKADTSAKRTYTGSQIAPLAFVNGLMEGRDYEVVYGPNVNVGTEEDAKESKEDPGAYPKGGWITIKGKRYYTGEQTYYFAIQQAGIAAQAVVEAIDEQTATGSAIEPSPVVKSLSSGAVLERGVDYELSYRDNVNPGTATVTVAGLGNWAGKQEATFTIEAAPGPAPVAGVWKRLAGNTALGTMKAIVNEGWEKSEYAIVATNRSYHDALSASGLAGLLECPVLITAPDALSAQTEALLVSKKVGRVVIVGGTNAVSSAVESRIKALGASVDRVGGGTAVGTANKIYEYGKTVNGGWGSDRIVATAGSYQDALSIAPYAYAKKAPIFLAQAKDGMLSEKTAKMLKAGTFARTIIVGGTAAVSSKAEEQVEKPGVFLERLAGNTAYGTCRRIAEFCLSEGMTAAHMGVATGRSYHDALVGAALCGKNNSILILADDKNSNNAAKVVRPHKADLQKDCYIFGGTMAVSAPVERAVKAVSE